MGVAACARAGGGGVSLDSGLRLPSLTPLDLQPLSALSRFLSPLHSPPPPLSDGQVQADAAGGVHATRWGGACDWSAPHAFIVQGSGFRVQGSGFRVEDIRCMEDHGLVQICMRLGFAFLVELGSQVRLTRSTVTSTVHMAERLSGCARCGAGSAIRYQPLSAAHPAPPPCAHLTRLNRELISLSHTKGF